MNLLIHQFLRLFAVAAVACFLWTATILFDQSVYVVWSIIGMFLSWWTIFRMTDHIREIRMLEATKNWKRNRLNPNRYPVYTGPELTDFSS